MSLERHTACTCEAEPKPADSMTRLMASAIDATDS